MLNPQHMDFPEHLGERVRWVAPAEPQGERPRFVLYWMRTAVRGHDNPALDVALYLAEQLDCPAFVYHAVSERYPFASDRHHTFILESARDVARELGERGIGYALHVEREGHRGPHLLTLAENAGIVVTEDMPVAPLRAWTEAVASRSGAPVALVDTACVVPMGLTRRAYDRAFQFRKATSKARKARLGRSWTDHPVIGPAWLPELPFEPVDLERVSIAALVASCRIDHAVAPVPDTPGGTESGYARWQAFVESGGLRWYAKRRNNAARDGVSRMSAYLHYGCVSPLRIAREAFEHSTEGSEKYLDELLVWRELSYHYCYHEPRHGELDAVPEWARQTLVDHESDRREKLLSWEDLARAKSGHPLWDAAQRSLLKHGELHNNVRMTWGKGLVPWTANAATAWRLLVDLNHRYALDGRDPASYGGLLWCLGGFDRPFQPEAPVWGTVRPRDLDQHAQRLDLEQYIRHVDRPRRRRSPKVAVIGAGVAGLACARTLADHGLQPVVLDKGRRPGGRISTRHLGDGGTLDHGSPWFRCRDPRFSRYVNSWAEDGIVANWDPRLCRDGELVEAAPRYVGTPMMSSLAHHLAADLDVRCNVKVASIGGEGPWTLVSEDGTALGEYDIVVLTVPAPQADPLLRTSESPGAAALAEVARDVELASEWAVLVHWAEEPDVPWDAAEWTFGPIVRVIANHRKPGRKRPGWMVYASECWTHHHLEDDREAVAAAVLGELSTLVPAFASCRPVMAKAHRWRFARRAAAETPSGEASLARHEGSLVLAADWLGRSDVESAFLAGVAAAGRVLSGEIRWATG